MAAFLCFTLFLAILFSRNMIRINGRLQISLSSKLQLLPGGLNGRKGIVGKSLLLDSRPPSSKPAATPQGMPLTDCKKALQSFRRGHRPTSSLLLSSRRPRRHCQKKVLNIRIYGGNFGFFLQNKIGRTRGKYHAYRFSAPPHPNPPPPRRACP